MCVEREREGMKADGKAESKLGRGRWRRERKRKKVDKGLKNIFHTAISGTVVAT